MFGLLAILTALFLLAAVVVLWPNLGTDHTGWTPGPARALPIATMAVGVALFGVAVAVGLRVLTPAAARTPVTTSPRSRPTRASTPSPRT